MLDGLIALIRENGHLFLDQGTVTAVDGDTCTVDAEGKEYQKCRINAVVKNGDDFLKLVPKIGSSVVIGVIPSNSNAVILSVSDVDTMEYVKGDTRLKVDAEGYTIERQEENLGQVTEDLLGEIGNLCDELSKVVVSVGVTPNVPVIEAIKNRVLNGIKGRFKKIYNYGT